MATLSKIIRQKEADPSSVFELYKFISYAASHEYQHIFDNLADVFDHNKTFYRNQKTNLSYLIATADIDQIEASLRTQFIGSLQTGAAVTQMIAGTQN